MKCPYCGTKGAEVNRNELLEGASIASAVYCKNPTCLAYKPHIFGFHPEMTLENKEKFKKYRKMFDNESDFDYILPNHFCRK